MQKVLANIEALPIIHPIYLNVCECLGSGRQLCNFQHIDMNGSDIDGCRYYHDIYSRLMIKGFSQCMIKHVSKVLCNKYTTLEKNTFDKYDIIYTTLCPLCVTNQQLDTLGSHGRNRHLQLCVRLCMTYTTNTKNELEQLCEKSIIITALPLIIDVRKVIIQFM